MDENILGHTTAFWSAMSSMVGTVAVIVLGFFSIRAANAAVGSLKVSQDQFELARKERQERYAAGFTRATYEFQSIMARVRNLRRALKDDSGSIPAESTMGDEWHNVQMVMEEVLPTATNALIGLGGALWQTDQVLTIYRRAEDRDEILQAMEDLKAPVEQAWTFVLELAARLEQRNVKTGESKDGKARMTPGLTS